MENTQIQEINKPDNKKLTGLTDAIDLGLLDTKTSEFYRTPGGFTGLKIGEKDYKRVSLRRALPLKDPLAFISIADEENKEIGLIRQLSDLSDDQLSIVNDELNKRYYCPKVKEVKSVKDKMGYVYIELVLITQNEVFDKNCAVKDVNKNIRLVDENRLIIFDVDGNRYIVESLRDMDKKSLKRLEPYLF